MPRNKVQFQKGMSLREFLTRFGTEAQCEQALFDWRWGTGFVCPRCGDGGAYCALKSRKLYQCHRCHHQSSLTSGTIFQGTKLPLRSWFMAMYSISQAKNGLSGLELSRALGISYNSAWLMKHKLMQVMKEREQRRRLAGLIQLDDAYWGGVRRGGKRGRGTRGKAPLLAALQTTAEGHPQAMLLHRVRGFRKREIRRWSRHHLQPGCAVRSDGLWCFAAVTEAGCAHQAVRTSGPRALRARQALLWVDTVLGNVKNAIHGTYHAIRHKHLPRYLAEFSYRFNRRFDLTNILARLATAATQTPPMPYRLIKLAESHW